MFPVKVVILLSLFCIIHSAKKHRIDEHIHSKHYIPKDTIHDMVIKYHPSPKKHVMNKYELIDDIGIQSKSSTDIDVEHLINEKIVLPISKPGTNDYKRTERSNTKYEKARRLAAAKRKLKIAKLTRIFKNIVMILERMKRRRKDKMLMYLKRLKYRNRGI